MGQALRRLFKGSNYGVIWNKSSEAIVYEVNRPWKQITKDVIVNDLNPNVKISADVEVGLGHIYKRGRVVSHDEKKTTVEVPPNGVSIQGLRDVEFGKTTISVKFLSKEGYIFKDQVIESEADMRLSVYADGSTKILKKQTAKELLDHQTQTASLNQENIDVELDQDDREFLKALSEQAQNEEH